MKRIFSIILALVLVLSLVGCVKPGVDPTSDPTETPADNTTEEPTEEPTPEPVVGIPDFCVELDTKSSNKYDIDFDGVDDQIDFVWAAANEYGDKNYEITVKTAAGAKQIYEPGICYDLYAWLIDCDPTDGRMELLISYVFDSDDWCTYALRLNDEKTGFRSFTNGYEIDSEIVSWFTSEGGFPVIDRTDILGTSSISGFMTINAEGFAVISDEYLYLGDSELKLKKEFTLNLVNDDGSVGEEITLKKGDKISPYSTDNSSFVKVLLPDGSLGIISVELVNTDTEWGIYVNGVLQDLIADIPYAD